MENNTLSKYANGFGLSLALSSVVNAILVIAKEKSGAVQSAMSKLTGHHWITHAAIVLLCFVFFGVLFAKLNHGRGIAVTPGKLLKILVGGVLAGSLIIIGFYIAAG